MTPAPPDIDLHPYFRDPDKARKILDLCIEDNRNKGINLIRVIHGKGKGNFRNIVQSHLKKHPHVDGCTICDPSHGGSGATWVHIRTVHEDRKTGIPERKTRWEPSAWRIFAYLASIGILYILLNNWIVPIIIILVFAAVEILTGKRYPKNPSDRD